MAVFTSTCDSFTDFSDGSPLVGSAGHTVTIVSGKVRVSTDLASAESGVRKNLSASSIRVFEFEHTIDAAATLNVGFPHTLSMIWDGSYTTELVQIRFQVLNSNEIRYFLANPASPYNSLHETTQRFAKGTTQKIKLVMSNTGISFYINDMFYGKYYATLTSKHFGVVTLGTFYSSAVTGVQTFDNVVMDTEPVAAAIPGTDEGKLTAFINFFLSKHMRSDGAIVRPYPNGNWDSAPQIAGGAGYQPWSDVVSESQAYGLLAAEYVVDKVKFDLIEQWTYSHLDRRNVGLAGGNLMGWHWSNERNVFYDNNSAHDADLDRIKALVKAHRRWGSTGTINYLARAKAIAADLEAIMRFNSTTGMWYLPSDYVQAGQTPFEFNPSYYDLVAMEMCVEFSTGASIAKWNSAIDGIFDIYTKAQAFVYPGQSSSAGLLPNWINFNPTTAAAADSARSNDQLYAYEAFRAMFRLAEHYKEYGSSDNRALARLAAHKTKFTTFWGTPGYIPAEINHDGTIAQSYELTIFSYAAWLALTANDAGNATAAALWTAKIGNRFVSDSEGLYYSRVASGANAWGYYDDAWIIFGEMQRLGDAVAPPTPPVVPDPTTPPPPTTPTAKNKLMIKSGSSYLPVNPDKRPITFVTTTPFNITDQMYFIHVDTTAARTVNLPTPNASFKGRYFVIRDATGGAATNNITITPTGGAVIEGAAGNKVINTAYGRQIYYTDGANWFRTVVA